MSSKDKYSVALRELKSHFPEGEALAILKILQEDLKEDAAFNSGLASVLSGIPVQQVVGYTEFLGCRIELNQHVLIPRPETEELVELILSSTSYPVPCTLLDIGTGSGCIPISISKNRSNWTIFATDVSSQALKLAVHNARLNKVKVEFILHDILSGDPWILPPQIDILVSNPPYVLQSESSQMKRQVLEHEPHLALFVPEDDPLIFYRRIAEWIKVCKYTGLLVYLECNEKFAGRVAELLAKGGFNSVLVHKDISGKDRFVSAVFS